MRLLWNKQHSICQLRWVCSKYTNICFAFYGYISCNLTVQRSRRKNVSMPSSMGWSELRSLALRSLKRWRKNGGFSNYRCVRSVVHLTWFENLSSSPEICHSLFCFYFLTWSVIYILFFLTSAPTTQNTLLYMGSWEICTLSLVIFAMITRMSLLVTSSTSFSDDINIHKSADAASQNPLMNLFFFSVTAPAVMIGTSNINLNCVMLPCQCQWRFSYILKDSLSIRADGSDYDINVFFMDSQSSVLNLFIREDSWVYFLFYFTC